MAVHETCHKLGYHQSVQKQQSQTWRHPLKKSLSWAYRLWKSDSEFRWQQRQKSSLKYSWCDSHIFHLAAGQEAKRLGTSEIPSKLHEAFLPKSFVLHVSNNTGLLKFALVILTVPFPAVSLCCRCQKCFEKNYSDFWKLVSSSGKEILLLNLWEKAFMRYNHCRVFGDWWNPHINVSGFTTAPFTPIC